MKGITKSIRTGLARCLLRGILNMALATIGIPSILAGGGQEDAAPEQTLSYNLVNELGSVDPGLATGVDQSKVNYALFEGLVKIGPELNVVPGVAERWDVSADGLVYTFHLRDEARWSDGEAVTSRDFVWSWLRSLDPATASRNVNDFFSIKNAAAYNRGEASRDDVGVAALDDRTLQVTLATPSLLFLQELLDQSFLPVRQDVVEQDPERWSTRADIFIGNGPFVLEDWRPRDAIVVTKNENYWNAASVRLDQVNFLILPDDSSALAAFRAGEVDLLHSAPASEIDVLQAEGLVETYPITRSYWYNFNLRDDVDLEVRRALGNKDVRLALNYAIDRVVLAEEVMRRGERPAGAYVPDTVLDHDGTSWRDYPDYVSLTENAAQAQELLARAGYPNGEGFPEIEILYNISVPDEAAALAIQDMWRRNLNIRTTLVRQETQVFAENRQGARFEITRGGWSSINDPVGFLRIFTTGHTFNWPGWSNEEFDRILAESDLQTDPAARSRLLRRAEDVLFEELPIVPLYYMAGLLVMQPYVRGIYTSGSGAILFDRAYIER